MKKNLTGFRFGKPGTKPRVLVTAGMDGDEFAGILAARELAKLLGSVEVSGELNVIPVVNTRGFYAGSGKNPADGKYPKRIYPGSAGGTPSDALIYGLRERYILGSDLWLDLHAGSLTEQLTPCILSYETGKPAVNSMTIRVLRNLSADMIIYEKKGAWQKTERLAQDGVSYFMFESGWGGSTEPADCLRHTVWVMDALGAIGIIKRRTVFRKTIDVARAIREEVARRDSIWIPVIHAGDRVEKGSIVGSLSKPDFGKHVSVTARIPGTVIWLQRTPNAAKGESLFAVAGEFTGLALGNP